ncbi:lysosomal alpha-mannosidase isoform X2 [Diabrotica virgifera virgifera]|uniref:Alpha-mannosidase n=1 Tax=Diabrotica virgifera virgifera TaxID=50390 RepID=A0ABM5L7T3_DIAVI|nr:lysosomal alpha-mannosidase isoform X2 [Diabrotica virgifera virgifera]
MKVYATTTPIAVKNIITSVVEELQRNKDRRYIQVETAFFYKWWKEQDETMRRAFKNLVDNGHLEIVNGGWSMNDEACTNYQSTIDQFTLGFRIIDEALGKCGRSRVGWQIDPFGHSREQASILAQMGYNGMFFSRLDHSDRSIRKEEHRMDFAWQGSANLDDSIIFGSIFPNAGYDAPQGFCWDISCQNDQIVDDNSSIHFNLEDQVSRFTDILDGYAKFYSKDNKNMLVVMGGDFQYQQSAMYFDNMDKLIKGFKNHEKYNLIYSTPSCYMKSVHDDNVNLTLKTDDFFPYSSSNHDFWAGYFTSRTNLKRFERVGNNILQATKQLYALSSKRGYDDNLTDLKQAMGTLQHHDAISGTATQEVTNDYVRTLTAAIKKTEEPLTEIIGELLEAKTELDWNLSSCLLTNFSICATSQNSDKFVVAIYNPLAWNATHYIRLPVEEGKYIINGPDGLEEYDLIPSLSKFDFVKIVNETPSAYELVFAARDIKPLGLKMFHIEKQKQELTEPKKVNLGHLTSFQLDDKTNLLSNVTLNGISLALKQNFYYYISSTGMVEKDYSTSGAYVFTPTKDIPEELQNVEVIGSYNGNLVEEVHQKWITNVSDIYQSIRWYKTDNHIELDWLVGNINTKINYTGIEVISRFDVSDFDNQNVFYTDSNGRETIKRIKNQRADYFYNISWEPVSSNYYPVTSKIVIKDQEKHMQMAILTDRSQGGSSLENNQIELMVHRRTIFDDGKGVGEPLSETEFNSDLGMYARGTHYLLIGDTEKINKDGKTTTGQERVLAQKKLRQPWIGLSPTKQTFDELKKSMNLQYSALNEDLPENVNILTLEPWTSGSYLLRFEHILEKNEDPNLSNKSTISIENLLKGINVHTITEMTLGANVPLSELNQTPRYVWNIKDESTQSEISDVSKSVGANEEISLGPMQIRTFIISTKSSTSNGNVALVNLFLALIVLLKLCIL